MKRGKFGSGFLFFNLSEIFKNIQQVQNPTKEPKKRSKEDGEQNDAYSMSDNNPSSSRLDLDFLKFCILNRLRL